MARVSLLAGFLPDADLARYLTRQNGSPEPGMRRVMETARGYACWLYEDDAWSQRAFVWDRLEAVSWWLADPCLPEHQGEGNGPGNGEDADGKGRDEMSWPASRWEEAATAMTFHVVMRTGVRPHEIGPESTETGAWVYQRMLTRRAAAQIYWYEGRSNLDDLRGSCPVRTDIAAPLRCAVLAEAAVLLSRRPHVHTYIAVDEAPDGVASEAANVMADFRLPGAAYRLLLR